MLYSDVIIIGGGPAGSTCAWKLIQRGVDCIILDKKRFPRNKLCAGWITPEVVKSLRIDLSGYPHSLVSLDTINFHFFGKRIKLKTCQYSIRRYEFDEWLLERSGAPTYHHHVKNIQRDGKYFIIDEEYRCKYLVGAAGTYCPVYRSLFSKVNPRAKDLLITSMEEEFTYPYVRNGCHLWFFENKLPGYFWYVPKGNGYVNIGVGGLENRLRQRNSNIKIQWQYLTQKLLKLSFIEDYQYSPKGYNYYLRQHVQAGKIDGAYIIGDAAGLATKDMGEGIGPAVKSGLLAAYSILKGTEYSFKSIPKYSIFKLILNRHQTRPKNRMEV